MHLKLFIFTFFLYSVSGTSLGNVEIFKWPAAYSLEAIRTSVSSGVIENYKLWYSKNKVRIDYNNGAVKSIIFGSSKKYENGIEYEIRPETDEDEEVNFKCYGKEGTFYDEKVPKSILPNPDESTYEFVGYEKIDDQSASKFVAKTVDVSTDITQTVWATYDRKSKVWLPVRYEVKEYSMWIGALTKYEIWKYFNVNTNKKKLTKNQFTIYDKYDCDVIEENDDSVTKELKFIDTENDKHVEHVFNHFVKRHDKKYSHDKEVAMRKAILKENMRLVKETNRRNLGYKLTLNHFADRTPEEMKKYRGLLRRPEGKVGSIPFPYTESRLSEISNELPTEYDARIYGLVSTVKNQEDCGSCWTFGTTAAAEGALARSNGGKLISLANQALIDCAWPYDVAGCNGGTDNGAYEWMQDYGLPTEADYGSYANKDGICHIKNVTKTYPIKGFTDVTPNSIGALKVALVNHGPLSVSVDAMSSTFSLYSGGIYYDTTCDPKTLNHEVALVGYGEKDGETFWIIKNSWGPHWGIDGYMHISSRDNACGITTEPTYVVF